MTTSYFALLYLTVAYTSCFAGPSQKNLFRLYFELIRKFKTFSSGFCMQKIRGDRRAKADYLCNFTVSFGFLGFISN